MENLDIVFHTNSLEGKFLLNKFSSLHFIFYLFAFIFSVFAKQNVNILLNFIHQPDDKGKTFKKISSINFQNLISISSYFKRTFHVTQQELLVIIKREIQKIFMQLFLRVGKPMWKVLSIGKDSSDNNFHASLLSYTRDYKMIRHEFLWMREMSLKFNLHIRLGKIGNFSHQKWKLFSHFTRRCSLEKSSVSHHVKR